MPSLIDTASGHPPTDSVTQPRPTGQGLGTRPPDPGPTRIEAIRALHLDDDRSVPAFEEAIQLVREHVGVPMGWVSVALGDTECLKATYGLSALGLGNPLAEDRRLPLDHSLSRYVLDRQHPWAVADATQRSSLSAEPMVTTYGVVAYCAVPLITSQRQCIGVLAAMDGQPREFSPRDMSFLAMAARWGMGEYERHWAPPRSTPPASGVTAAAVPVNALRLHLLGHLIQDLRNPLTAVLGMTSMLGREIYGPLTKKQREYLEIVRSSSQTLIKQVDEILDLGWMSPESTP